MTHIDPKATDPSIDDTEGNHFTFSDAEIKHDVVPVGSTPEADRETNDTEGNLAKWGVDQDAPTDDTEGNHFTFSDAEIKHDVVPVASAPESANESDDTEGNNLRIG